MAFGIPDNIVARVLVEETLGLAPNADTQDVAIEFRLKVRRQVAAIKEAGGEIDIPNATKGDDDVGGAVPL